MAAGIDGFPSAGAAASGVPLHVGLESFSGNPTLPSQSMPGEVSGSNWASDPVQFIRSIEERLESFAASRGEQPIYETPTTLAVKHQVSRSRCPSRQHHFSRLFLPRHYLPCPNHALAWRTRLKCSYRPISPTRSTCRRSHVATCSRDTFLHQKRSRQTSLR